MILRELIIRVKADTKRATSDLKVLDKQVDDVKESAEAATEEVKELGKETEKTGKKTARSGKRMAKAWKSFRKGLKAAAKEAREGAATIAKGVTVATAAVTAGSVAAFAMAKDWAEATGDIAKRSENLGVPADKLQELQFAAKASRVDVDAMNDAIRETELRSAEAALIGSGPFIDALKVLNLDIKELRKQDPATMFGTLRNALSELDNEADRSFLAEELFGGAAEQLGGIVKITAAEFAGLKNEARELGAVLSDEAIQAANEFNRELFTTQTVLEVFKGEVLQELIPTIKDMLSGLRDWIKANRELAKRNVIRFLKEFLRVFEAIARAVPDIIRGFNEVTESVGGLDNALQLLGASFVAFKLAALGPIGAVAGAFIGLIALIDTTEKKMRRVKERREKLLKQEQFSKAEREQLEKTEAGRTILAGIDVQKQRAAEVEARPLPKPVIGRGGSPTPGSAQRIADIARERTAIRDEAAQAVKNLTESGKALARAQLEQQRKDVAEVQATGRAIASGAADARRTRTARSIIPPTKKKKEERDATLRELLGAEEGAVVSAVEGKGLGTTIVNQTFNVGIPSIRILVEAARGATARDQAVKTADAVRELGPTIMKSTQRASAGQIR